MCSAGSHNPILVPWITIVPGLNLQPLSLWIIVPPIPTNDQAHCFRNVPLRDRERSSAASASEGKVERIDLRLLSNQQVRAFAHSAPALQLDDLARAFDSTSLALASDHQVSAFESTNLALPLLLLLKIATSRMCPSTVRLVIFTTVTLREYVETVAPLQTVDVMAVIVVATSVTRQDPHKASKARHIIIKGRNCADRSSRALEANKHGCTRKKT